MVKSVKQDQVITKDGEIFRKVQVKCKKKYATPGGGLQFDPGQ